MIRNALIVVFVLSNTLAQSQTGISLPDLLKLKSENRTDVSPLSQKSTPVDSPVDPAEYFVGPGDSFVLNIWSSAPVEYRITVTPEATLLIPNVGVVDVRDQTLQSVKKSVAKAVGKRYTSTDVTLNLVAPRTIVVQVTGEVFNEGKHEVNSLQRVDNLIALANALPPGVSDPGLFWATANARTSSSLRNIIIQRKNGVKLRADLIRYMATGEGKYNPYLREGDQILVPSRWQVGYGIGISGGVRKWGSFEFVPGDSLSDLIEMGYGFKSSADSTHGILTRLAPNAMSMEEMNVNPAAILSGATPDIALRPGDRLVIKEISDPRKAYIVDVSGEVKQPGQYPLTLNSTRLSDAIRVAGGFTENANIKAATLIRARISPQATGEEIAQEQLLSSRNNLSFQDSSYYVVETLLRLKGELVSVDFEKLFVQKDSTKDVTLRNYDRIIVPPKTGNVYVFGQVLAPGHLAHVDGKDYRYYISKASGFTREAREDEVKIIKGSTREWLDPGETEIEDGDYIWVPKELHYPFSYHLTMYAQIAAIIGTVATVALLINNFSK